jgi:hypothetical protein
MSSSLSPVVLSIEQLEPTTLKAKKEKRSVSSKTSTENLSHRSSFSLPKGRTEETSWSDSNGSTYVSEMCEEDFPKRELWSCINKNNNDWTKEDMKDLDAVLAEEEADKNGNHGENNWNLEKSGKLCQERPLQGIDYFSAVEVASTNSDLSTLNSLQKEDAESIFCRRLIPLDIPVEDTTDEISVISIINEPSQIEAQRVKNELGDLQKKETIRLSNVDYHTSVDIASDHEDISTVGYKIPIKIAREAFDRTKKMPAENEKTSFELPKAITRNNSSASNLSSLNSDSYEEHTVEEAYSDGESDDAARPTKTAHINVKAIFQKYAHIVGNQSNSEDIPTKLPQTNRAAGAPFVNTKASEDIVIESSADVRIQNLKKKIIELNKDNGKTPEPPTIKYGYSHRKRSFMDADQIEAKIEELTRTTKSMRKKRGSDFVDPTGGLKLWDTDDVNKTQFASYHNELSPVKIDITQQNTHLTIGERLYTQLEIPSGKDDDDEDEVSTMMGDNNDFEAPPDMETALRTAIERKKNRNKWNKRLSFGRVKREALYYVNKGKEKFVSAACLKQPSGPIKYDIESTAAVTDLWIKFMNGRNKGEAILIIVIAVALFILFILLVVVLSGR